ncbi:MAG: 23S rRNA (uracil(1939)-C(5))-methyltransferase RlmD [Spirochaetes bacterium]|nr:23S rRNA (uracil(1939)-C(5))-methyltransferase RlmD [Spirochaetota bacterium]
MIEKELKNKIPVKPGDTIEALIHDLTHDGRGICRFDGYTVFVKNALPQEKCEIKIIKTGKKFGEATLIKRFNNAEIRAEDQCPNPSCSGCSLINMKYDAQLSFKEKSVKNTLNKTVKIPNLKVSPIIPMEDPFHYRNKASFHLGTSDNGSPLIGFYKPGTHEVVSCTQCSILDKSINELYDEIKKMIEGNPAKFNGNILDVIVRKGDKLLICFIVTKAGIISEENVSSLTKADSIIETPLKTDRKATDWKNAKLLKGKNHTMIKTADLIYRLSARSFFQVNTRQADILFKTAIGLSKINKTNTVADIYCGVGALSLMLAKKTEHVWGIEISKRSVKNAAQNAALNDIYNASFHAGKADKLINDLFIKKKITPDVFFIDPPREGCEKNVIELILKIKPKRIIYISCNPATLARDILYFTAENYLVKRIKPVDMFPHTHHVEVVTVLERP